jgi:protein-tyrosine phosphatase
MFNFFSSNKLSITDVFPNNFIDIHSHILPAIDDGSKSFDESLELLKRMHGFGIKKIVLTPHVMDGLWENSSIALKQRFHELQDYLTKNDFNSVELHLAAEYMLDANFSKLLKTEKLLTIKDSYVLVEMSYLSAPINLYEILFEIQVAGYKPILAHPERYSFYHNNYPEYRKLKDVGCLLQLNLLSLSNYYGKDVSKIAKKLLKDNLIDLVGSDTHNNRHLNYLEMINNQKIIQLIRPVLKNNSLLY